MVVDPRAEGRLQEAAGREAHGVRRPVPINNRPGADAANGDNPARTGGARATDVLVAVGGEADRGDAARAEGGVELAVRRELRHAQVAARVGDPDDDDVSVGADEDVLDAHVARDLALATRAEGGVDRAGLGVAGDAEASPPADAGDQRPAVGERVDGVDGVEESVDQDVVTAQLNVASSWAASNCLGSRRSPNARTLRRCCDNPTTPRRIMGPLTAVVQLMEMRTPEYSESRGKRLPGNAGRE